MWPRTWMLRVGAVSLWLVSGIADGQAPTVTSPPVSPASRVPTQLPGNDCSSMTSAYNRRMVDLLSAHVGITGSLQSQNLLIQQLRQQLEALQAERARLAVGGIAKSEAEQASQLMRQIDSLTAQIEGAHARFDDLMSRLQAIQEEMQRLNAEYAAQRKALRCV